MEESQFWRRHDSGAWGEEKSKDSVVTTDSAEVLAFRRKEEDGACIYKELATREGQTCKQGDPCTDSSEESLAEESKRERYRGEGMINPQEDWTWRAVLELMRLTEWRWPNANDAAHSFSRVCISSCLSSLTEAFHVSATGHGCFHLKTCTFKSRYGWREAGDWTLSMT